MDYGLTWSGSEIAISTLTEGNLPHGIVADADWVHIVAEPGAGTYARRAAPQRLEFTSIEKQAERLILKWTGRGALQEGRRITGPWNTVTDAFSPHELSNEFATGFFRLKRP